jgi:hypothetical protein
MITVSTKTRLATAAAAVAAAATFMPAVANAAPPVPVPQAAVGNTLGGATVNCGPLDPLCTLIAPGGSGGSIQTPLFWFGPSNPSFQPLIGITFPNFFGVDFEACVFGGAIRLAPYGGGFVGLGLGC